MVLLFYFKFFLLKVGYLEIYCFKVIKRKLRGRKRGDVVSEIDDLIGFIFFKYYV